MAEERISYTSKGLKLVGTVRVPAGVGPGERRPAFMVLHGFGSNMNSRNVLAPCAMLEKLGYVTLRFDMPGCGESEGESGLLICHDQVQATRDALTWLAKHPNVEPDRIAVIGSSFGAAVAVYTGGIDKRVAAVISSGGWGDGARKFRRQHPTPEAWERFVTALDEGRSHRARTGKPLMMKRYDIVPIPEHLRGHLAAGSVQEFPAETAQSMYDFRADDVVGGMTGRPLLLLHSSFDSVTPTEESVELFRRAGKPTDLHLFSETDHFMFAESNTRVRTLILDWLERYFPVKVKEPA